MAITGLPDFSRTPQQQLGAVARSLLGSVVPAAPTISTTFAIDDKTTIIGLNATLGWYSPTGPYTWNMKFRFAGNIAGSFDMEIGISIRAAGSVEQQNIPFSIAVPIRLGSLLGSNANTQLTWSFLSTLPDGQAVMAANMMLGTS